MKEGMKKKVTSPFKNLRKTIILGNERFKKEIYKNQQPHPIVPQKDDLALAKKIIKLVTQNSTWPSLKAKKKRIAKAVLSRNAAIYFLKKFTDLNNKQISHFFPSLHISSISQMSRRFNLVKEKYKSLKKITDVLESKVKAIALNKK